jgi:hypothetical protein
MSMDEDLAAPHRRTSDPAHRAGCPTADELFSLLGGSASPAERERLVDHVAGCTACAEEVRLMRSLQPWAEGLAGRLAAPEATGSERHQLRAKGPFPLGGGGLEKGEGQDGGGPREGNLDGGSPHLGPPPVPTLPLPEGGRPHPRTRSRLLPLALAAALLAAVIGTGIVLRRDVIAPPDSTVLRGAQTEEVSPAPDAVLQEPPGELEWAPQPGATGYRPQILDEEANRLWEGAVLAEPKAAIPAEARSRLRPGASYFWIVEVEGPARRRQLGPYWFRLADR